MGIASSYAPCGCAQSRLMEPADDVWIEWVRCAVHYQPEVDDPLILIAAKNRREYDAASANGEGR